MDGLLRGALHYNGPVITDALDAAALKALTLDRPDATAAMIDSDGWLRTRDLGYEDAAGDIFVVDGLKELIKMNAYQVAPAELEALIETHPQVAEAAVIPRPDELSGEVPVAVVVRRGSLERDHLIAWVADRVSPQSRFATCGSSPRSRARRPARSSAGVRPKPSTQLTGRLALEPQTSAGSRASLLGLMFWFSRKKFPGSYLSFSSTSRS